MRCTLWELMVVLRQSTSAKEQILMLAGYSVKTAALTGPPRPSVYCLKKCFGAQKPGTALKHAKLNSS